MLTRGAVLLAALALIVSGAAAAAGNSTVAGAPGIGDPYFPLDGNGGIDVRTYEVHDAYRFSGGLLSGWTKVTLRTTQRLSSFDLSGHVGPTLAPLALWIALPLGLGILRSLRRNVS